VLGVIPDCCDFAMSLERKSDYGTNNAADARLLKVDCVLDVEGDSKG
jgi:hypothetical protein